MFSFQESRPKNKKAASDKMGMIRSVLSSLNLKLLKKLIFKTWTPTFVSTSR